MYATPHRHDSSRIISGDHAQRLKLTLELAQRFIDDSDLIGADLSCGDAALAYMFPGLTWFLGDFAPGYPIRGPIEETIHQVPSVDVFVCCETIEHLENPDAVLAEIRKKTKKLILSTPVCTWIDENPEHIWAWDTDAVLLMLGKAGFTSVGRAITDAQPGYIFQIHTAV